MPIQVFGLGTVEAQTVSRIGFETAGTLVELHADHGDSVKAGTLLARLHSREQEARVAQARAAVAQAQAGIEQAESAVEKAEVVLKQKVGDQSAPAATGAARRRLARDGGRHAGRGRRGKGRSQPGPKRRQRGAGQSGAGQGGARPRRGTARQIQPLRSLRCARDDALQRARLGAQRQRAGVHSWSIPPRSGRSPTSTRREPGRSRSDSRPRSRAARHRT